MPLLHDLDSFDGVLKAEGVKMQKAAPRSPNTCASVERFIRSLQQECHDYFGVFGEQHMDHLVSEMVAHYHEERPHQGKEKELLSRRSSILAKKSASRPIRDIHCQERLGGW